MGIREFHPSDEESGSLDKQFDQETETKMEDKGNVFGQTEDIDDSISSEREDNMGINKACLSQSDCNKKGGDHQKYLDEDDSKSNELPHEDKIDDSDSEKSGVEEKDDTRTDLDGDVTKDRERDGKQNVREVQGRTTNTEHLERGESLGSKKGDDLTNTEHLEHGESLSDKKGDDLDEEEEESMDDAVECGLCDDDEEEEDDEMAVELTPDEANAQRIVDGEGLTDETRGWMQDMMKIDENAYFLLDEITVSLH